MDENYVFELLRDEIREDVGDGDVTCDSLGVEFAMSGRFVAKEDGVIAGFDVVAAFLKSDFPSITLEDVAHDGARVDKGATVASIAGPAKDILIVERTVLNFLQHLSGVATATRQLVDASQSKKKNNAVVLDTRKTLPAMRMLQKYAVEVGGGHNHRLGLHDQVLIKDNHLATIKSQVGDGYIAHAIHKARTNAPKGTIIEVEIESIEQMLEAAEAGADIIMLDNMDVPTMTEAVKALHAQFPDERPQLEASGNINLSTIADVGTTGVDRISVGSITHSVKALDISLRLTAHEG